MKVTPHLHQICIIVDGRILSIMNDSNHEHDLEFGFFIAKPCPQNSDWTNGLAFIKFTPRIFVSYMARKKIMLNMNEGDLGCCNFSDVMPCLHDNLWTVWHNFDNFTLNMNHIAPKSVWTILTFELNICWLLISWHMCTITFDQLIQFANLPIFWWMVKMTLLPTISYNATQLRLACPHTKGAPVHLQNR